VIAARTWESAWRVAALYLAVAIATTWPLARRLGSAVPSDLGDPLLNAFILDWGLTHLSALAGGDLAAFRAYWHAPIFHPAPLALAYSEHMLAQAAMIWPLYALGGNILLCYNVLFLATFVLSGLGMYLFTRELTGSPAAAVVAGLLYGFALYRVPQYPHLQTLSSHWLPFALYGLRRFFATRALLPLAGATLALIAQNLSNGYYLLFFSIFVAAYCLAEIADRRAWRDVRVLAGLSAAGIATAVATLPVLVPYLALRALGFQPRGLGEVQAFSADALAWVTASPAHRLWGWLRPVAKPEGELFPGLVTIGLAGLATVAYFLRLRRAAPVERSSFRRVAIWLLASAALAALGFTLLVEATGDPHWRVAGIRVTMREPLRGYLTCAVLALAAFVLSARARHFARGEPGTLIGFFIAAAAATALVALGPTLEVAGAATGVPMPYSLLYYHVPGFDGLRVPARVAMVTLACLSVLGAFGARHVLSRGRGGRRALVALAAFFVVESTSVPITLDQRASPGRGVAAGPPRVFTGEASPAVYRFLSTLPATTVVLEFPFGASGWDLPSVFYQRVHRHPIVNGYSGGFPVSYYENRDAFDHFDLVPAAAWQRVRLSGATHVVVHRAAFTEHRARTLERWLVASGARVLRRFGADVVYEVPAAGQ
jgi:hypothetical protein